jgi:ATP-binding cassette subfamily B protein
LDEVPDTRPQLAVTRGEIVFDRVHFKSSSSGRLILRDVSFRIAPGSRVAIVGPSGSGKSSLARLLVRLETPDAGRILVDGQDVSLANLNSVRRAVGLVSQDAALLNRTVYENLTYSWGTEANDGDGDRPRTTERASEDSATGRSESEPGKHSNERQAAAEQGREIAISKADRTKVMRACQVAQIDELVQRVGLLGRIGQRGALLSGGERQRLAVARTLLSRAPIVVLDEATSALDMYTERALLNALRQELSGRTCIFIAHRLSAVSDADLIIVMGSDGSIVETGTHHELLSHRHGPYYALWHAHDLL